MASLNRCSFIGNLGQDPEVKTMGNGNKVANLSIACTDKWRDKTSGENRERTEWVRIVIWNENLVKVAEQYLKKGSKVFIEGQMQTRKYEKDGKDVYTTEIVLSGFNGQIIILDSRKDGDTGGADNSSRSDGGSSAGSSQRPGKGGGSGGGAMDSDDIPFAAIF